LVKRKSGLRCNCYIDLQAFVFFLSNQLGSVQEKLGSMLDKSTRVESMVDPLASALGLDEASLATARQAAPLATADLATAMVKEFTSLAGIMGRHYALREGQPLPVSTPLHLNLSMTSEMNFSLWTREESNSSSGNGTAEVTRCLETLIFLYT
jgi:hypothetical protein